jgi:hypothetical protein
MSTTEWKGWAVIDETRGLVYVRQEHSIPEIGAWDVRREARQRADLGDKVRVTRVRIIEETRE